MYNLIHQTGDGTLAVTPADMQMTPENSLELKFLTIEETAEILRVKRRSVYLAVTGRLRGTPQLPALRFGKRILIKREKLDQWVEQNYGGLANDTGCAKAQDSARKRH